MRTIVTRQKTQTRSCGSNFRMRLERDDMDTRGPRELEKGDVRGVAEVVLGEHLPKPTRRDEVALRRGSKLEVAQDTVCISRPELSLISPWHWCRRRQQPSCWGVIYVHPEEQLSIISKSHRKKVVPRLLKKYSAMLAVHPRPLTRAFEPGTRQHIWRGGSLPPG
jgi:hypothetical protein